MKLFVSLTRKLIDSVMAYGKAIQGFFVESGLPEALTSKPYQNFIDTYNRMEAGYMKARKYAFTQKLIELDDARDLQYRALRRLVDGLSYTDNAEEAGAGKLLLRLFGQYGQTFLTHSYLKESAKMSSFLADLKKPEYAAAVVTLKLEAKVAKLDDLEVKFEQTYQLRIKDKTVGMPLTPLLTCEKTLRWPIVS